MRMVEDHLKAVLKNEVMEHHFDTDKPKSMVSMYSSNSSQDEDDETSSSNHTMGLRSPVGGALRGRSVKEIEEQLSNLKKENFNLKLRIYFLEEKMGTNFTLDKDNIVKKNIELQIEIANLQKEVQEKHQLLCQAVKAMELEEEEHKKYVSSKEEQLNMCQQELDDLRLQLQDTKFESDVMSLKSDTTGFYSGRATNSGNNVTDLQEKIKNLEDELHLEKENNASLQFAIGQAETWKIRCETMQKEFQVKDEIIKTLTDELNDAKRQILALTVEMKELKHKYEITYTENESLHETIRADNKKIEDVANQISDLRKKYSLVKGDLEREQRKAERVKIINDMKISELEEENQKLKTKLREMQNKLETAMMEIRKNQNLAVPKSPKKTSSITNTDINSISVQDSTTPARVAEKDSLLVPIKNQNPDDKNQSPNSPSSLSPFLKSSSSPCVPATADKFNVRDFEEFLNRSAAGDKASCEKILSQIDTLKKENRMQHQKIIKLKNEQMKACGIIKNMMESRKKADEEINQLKEHVKNLEHELESVVSKPNTDVGDGVSSKQEANVITGSKSEDEKSPSTSMADRNSSSKQNENEDNIGVAAMEDAEIVERYKSLAVELETKAEVLVAILNEKDYQMQNLRQQYEEILTTLEERENRIVDLEFELVTASESGRNVDQSLLEKSDKDSEKHSSFYRHEIEEKDKEIEKLTVELKKCTCYLQEIVNKELWAKNKEIEKLHNKQANSPEIVRLKKELMGKEYQLNVLKEKISELGLDINLPTDVSFDCSKELSSPVNINHIKNLQEQLENCKAERNYFKEKLNEYESSNINEIITDLRNHNEALKQEVEKSENLREKSQEVCAHLSTRLEELAVFLDSLLRQKSILGFLGIHKEKRLREIINTSLDLSKSFAMSMIINPDQSLTQLSNITSLLNGSTFQDLTLDRPKEVGEEAEESNNGEQAVLSIVPTNITLTYQSHLHKVDKNTQPNSEQVINALRQQILNLKSELQLRDIELNKLNTLKETTDAATDTDSVDVKNVSRNVKDMSLTVKDVSTSIQDTSKSAKEVSKLFIPSLNPECLSESEAWSEPDINVSRERIGLSQTLPVMNYAIESTEENDSLNSTTPTRKTFEKRVSFTELHQQIAMLQEEVRSKTDTFRLLEPKLIKLKELEEKLKETELKLVETETELKHVEADAIKLQKHVEMLEKSKEELQEQMTVKNKEMQNKINQLELEKTKTSKIAEEVEAEATAAKQTIKEMDEKLKTLQKESAETEERIKKEYEEMTFVKITEMEEEFVKKLKEIESKAKTDFNEFKEDYSRNYVRKSDVDEKLNELAKLQKEIAAFKSVVRSYEEAINEYTSNEKHIENKMKEYQEKINVLKKELDKVTLQYSEAVLEKTKLTNENTILEQEVNKYRYGGSQLKRRVEDIRNDFEKANDSYHVQIKLLQKCKSDLEMKISELESVNAELHNKLVRLQANRSDFNYSMPELSSKNVQTVQIMPYRRQISGQTCTSEEILDDCFDRMPVVHPNLQAAGDIERREANSSPDLGIESDQGRFSSLEIQQNVTRPLLQTLELTESMNNLLDGDETIPIDSGTCGTEHCCQKTLNIAHENNDLKRKNQKLRKALQDTLNQLNLANQRKKQVEKTICKQIHKTSQVLRQAKANLDSGSETDLFKS